MEIVEALPVACNARMGRCRTRVPEPLAVSGLLGATSQGRGHADPARSRRSVTVHAAIALPESSGPTDRHPTAVRRAGLLGRAELTTTVAEERRPRCGKSYR